MCNDNPLGAIRYRADQMRSWLATAAPAIVAEQRHLDAESSERAYWHLGYQSALKDILALVNERHWANSLPQSSQPYLTPRAPPCCSLRPIRM
jgi:hypothetical protein